VQKERRRLSVGEVDKSKLDEVMDESCEEERGNIASLDKEDIMNILGGSEGGRKFSVGSTNDQQKVSFQDKTKKVQGEFDDTSKSCLGYTCRKGLKPESPNQDSWTILRVEVGENETATGYSIYGVFDGHGQKGHEVSNFVKETLPKLIIKDSRFENRRNNNFGEMANVLKDAFKKMQSFIATYDQMKKVEAKLSGTTATIAIHDTISKKVVVAHVADSTGVRAKLKKGAPTPVGTALTRDHKPDLPDERKRIESNGGRVVFDGYANHRVYAKNARYPGLNMSRCLGDLMGHQDCGISCEPEVSIFDIEDDDFLLLLCSDGVWEFIEPDEAVKIVSPKSDALEEQNAVQNAADKLAKEAWDRWIQMEGGSVVDDITVVIVKF
jgi:serine/threonine protein phosphatase PrpC